MTLTPSGTTSLPSNSSKKSGLACGTLAAIGLSLCWFGLAPLVVAGLQSAALASLAPALNHFLGLILLAGLLVVPVIVALLLARRPSWQRLKPLGLSLSLVVGYALAAVAVRAVAGENDALESGLRLVGLTLVAVGAGIAAMRVIEIPLPPIASIFGLRSPSLAGLALGGGLIGLLTLGWPLTGALGDSWTSLGLLLQALAMVLPEEILFRGVIAGILTHNRRVRIGLATILSLLLYLVFLPTQVLPAGDWEALALLFVWFPLALLTTQLRYLTGSIWAGTLLAWFYRALPLLFTDPRDEILEPAQWLAGGGMVLGAALLALLVWLGRRSFSSRRSLSRRATLGLVITLAIVAWAGWLSAWVFAGEPGFHNDGFIIVMEEQADLSAAYQIDDPLARRAYVYETLVGSAEETQAAVRARLDSLGYTYRPHYLTNMIQVEGHHRRRERFADLPGVAYLLRNPNVRPYPTHTSIGAFPAPAGNGVEWNIRRTGADAVWEMGYRGQGVVVGGQDTGYDWEHPALRDSYRGWDADTDQVDHNYNWHDAWDDTPAPHDDGEHGTHTMGTVLGRDGGDNQIGMAPEARWIGCRNMRRGIGNPASYTECMEFLLAPYPLGGDPFRDGDVTRAPDVINNSWSCPDHEGCQEDTLTPAVEAMRAAGIMMVVSAGNEGPACQTAAEPPARYDAVFSVGATDPLGTIVFFSSRGPVPLPGESETLLKPDVVAPGSNIRSSTPGGDYRLADGTSMSGPHVTGLVALLWSARPDLRGQVEATEEIIRRSARPTPVSAACAPSRRPLTGGVIEDISAVMNPEICACGGVTGVPNNVYGWGEIDALQAVEMALER